MYSSSLTAGTPATIQQYNRLREDARGASLLLCHESTTPSMTVVVESGYFVSSAGATVAYAGGTQVIGAVGAQPRWDLISINTSGTLVLTVGTASGSPVKPTLPATNFPIAYVYLRVGGTSIKSEDDTTNHYIQDARLLFSNPTDAETLATLGTKLFTAAGKTTPVDADGFSIFDSASSNAIKTLTFTNLKAYIKTWYDAVTSTLTNKTIAFGSNTVSGTKAQFNTAVTDGDIMFLDSADTITGAKTFSTAPVLNALPTGTAVASVATVSTIATRDASGILRSVNSVEGFTTTATEAGTTTLTVASTFIQSFTGSTTQTVVLPVATTLTVGHSFLIENNSSGLVTVQSSGLNTLHILPQFTNIQVICKLASGTNLNSWDWFVSATAVASGKKLSVNNSVTLAGTDGTTMTFPSTSATLARTDAANTFTGVQTMTSPNLITPVLGTPSSGNLQSCTADGTNTVGFKEIPQNSQSVAYTAVLADSGKHLYHPSADTTARTWTIPANSSVAYPIGTALTFVNDTSAGVITIAITTDTLVLAGAGTTGSRTLAANGIATAIKVTSTRWIISGTNLT